MRAGTSRTFRRDARAWLLLLGVGLPALVAARGWTHRPLLDPKAPAVGVREARLAVLAFERVVEQPDGTHLDRERLRAHLAALARAGFRPVTLPQVAAFYLEDAPLPPRSLLLSFDHGDLSTALAVDPLLRERRWPAVLFLPTAPLRQRDPSFVLWPRLRRMQDSGLWEIGSHGHRGHERIATDTDGGTAPFYGARAWLPEQRRLESDAELQGRLAEDHAEARRLLVEELGGAVLAWAPPRRGSFLAARDPAVAREVATAAATYPLVFEDGPFGVNDRAADPHHLRRLRVAPFWSSAELTARLEAALTTPAEAAPAASRDEPGSWIPWAGERQLGSDEVAVAGPGRADLWRAGSRWARDWVLEADVWFEGSQFWLVQGSADRQREWRWGGDALGTHLQTRRRGGDTETLASSPVTAEPGRWHRLRVVRRGAGVWVEWDGRPVAERPGYLPGRWSDSVGCVSWGEEDVRLRLRSPRFASFPYRVQALGGWPDAAEVQQAIREAPALAAVSPHWLAAGEGGVSASPLDGDLMRILAHRYGWEVVPGLAVQPDATAAVDDWLPAALSRAQRDGWAGLRLDLAGLPQAQRETVAHAAEEARRTAGWAEARLVFDPPRATGPAHSAAGGEP